MAILYPCEKMIIYETTRELMTARKLTKKDKTRMVRRLLLIIDDGKKAKNDR